MTGVVAAVIVGLAALIVGLLVGYILRKSIGEKTIGNAEQKAKNLILDAENRAETLKKEKILEAKRAGIKEIILSDENRKNIEEIQDIYLKGLTFHYVKDIKEVFAIALTDEKVADAIDLSVKKEKTEKKEE